MGYDRNHGLYRPGSFPILAAELGTVKFLYQRRSELQLIVVTGGSWSRVAGWWMTTTLWLCQNSY
jgi:hypothetical protein